MKTVEILFFGVALLLPLVGGGVLLYVLSKGAKKDGSPPDGTSHKKE